MVACGRDPDLEVCEESNRHLDDDLMNSYL